jgi:molybdopterin molybdotransferase
MMISFEDAYTRVMDAAPLLDAETVPLEDAAGRVLAQDVVADLNMPPFDKAAVDGYACRRADLRDALTVIETIPAGRMPSKTVGASQCSKIMTGAPVPQGADCVIMQEYTESPSPGVIRFVGQETEDNICRKAEDLKTGNTVLRRGERIGPAQMAVLASVGVARPIVALRPRVAVGATGSELVAAGQRPDGAMIRDSNSPQLRAQARGIGAVVDHLGIIPDSEAELTATVRQAMKSHDLLLLSGGVSVGAFDLVPATLRQCGFGLLFERVAMQPGKPMVFGRAPNNVFCCGIPGNPVSTYVVFELMLKPFLLKMMGHAYKPAIVRVRMGKAFARRKTDRRASVPVRFLSPDTVAPVEYHGSAHIRAMCEAEALLTMPVGVSTIAEGEVVDVRLL